MKDVLVRYTGSRLKLIYKKIRPYIVNLEDVYDAEDIFNSSEDNSDTETDYWAIIMATAELDYNGQDAIITIDPDNEDVCVVIDTMKTEEYYEESE